MLLISAILAAVAFLSANIDDLFLLVGFFSDPTIGTRRVVAGQYLGAATLIFASLLCSRLALAIPRAYIRTLGLLPLFIGLKDLTKVVNDRPRWIDSRSTLQIAAVTVSCGADNIAVYVPLFAGASANQCAVTVVVFVAMVGVWCAAARWLLDHRTMGNPVRHWGQLLLPWILIALGSAVLLGFSIHEMRPPSIFKLKI
jgi:cadmium resistance protein CadD (predicted permease)